MGTKNSSTETVMIEPDIGFAKMIRNEPWPMLNDCRMEASASGLSIMANTAGAIG